MAVPTQTLRRSQCHLCLPAVLQKEVYLAKGRTVDKNWLQERTQHPRAQRVMKAHWELLWPVRHPVEGHLSLVSVYSNPVPSPQFTWVQDRLDNVPVPPLGLHAF